MCKYFSFQRVCTKVWVSDGRSVSFNPLTTKTYNFLTYVQASFSWLKKTNFQTKIMFTYSFEYAFQEPVVKIEFGLVGNPIWRQI